MRQEPKNSVHPYGGEWLRVTTAQLGSYSSRLVCVLVRECGVEFQQARDGRDDTGTTVGVYGNKWAAAFPEFWGEGFDTTFVRTKLPLGGYTTS